MGHDCWFCLFYLLVVNHVCCRQWNAALVMVCKERSNLNSLGNNGQVRKTGARVLLSSFHCIFFTFWWSTSNKPFAAFLEDNFFPFPHIKHLANKKLFYAYKFWLILGINWWESGVTFSDISEFRKDLGIKTKNNCNKNSHNSQFFLLLIILFLQHLCHL